MKVLFAALGVHAGVGGIERFNQRVLRTLSELASTGGGESNAVVLWDGPEHRAQAPPNVGFTPGGRSKSRMAAEFHRHLHRMRPDVILYGHVLLTPLALVARVMSPRSRNVLVVHGREVWKEPFRRRVPVWERTAVRCGVDKIVSVSRLTADRMAQAYGLSETHFYALPNALDTPGEEEPRQRRCGGGFRLLTVARLGAQDRHKGCDRVIRALPEILRGVPSASYTVVGDGPLRAELERVAAATGVQDRVHFKGYVGDGELSRLYGESDVFVMPSWGEGFGIVFLEAWKHGLPVVAGNRDASAEVITHGHDGLCVDPDSPNEIADAVVSLAAGDAAEKMGSRGRATLLARYTQDHFRTRLHGILQSEARAGSQGQKERVPGAVL